MGPIECHQAKAWKEWPRTGDLKTGGKRRSKRTLQKTDPNPSFFGGSNAFLGTKKGLKENRPKIRFISG